MQVRNVHERVFPHSSARVGALIDSLASTDDQLWPGDRWPPMRLDRSLAVGARGGHGPIRYFIEAYEPGRHIRFRFTAPEGFCGTHGFEVEPVPSGGARLRHVLSMQAEGPARLSWPVVFRPLHDALIEDALGRASHRLGIAARARGWSSRVRALRWLLRRVARPRTVRSGPQPA